jgi:UDPglucose 6-dehydrogenase
MDLVEIPEAVKTTSAAPHEPLHILAVGAGVVGHATGIALREQGHLVAFSDIDDSLLSRRRSQGLETIPMDEIELVGVDVVLVSVSTPTVGGEIDLHQLEAALATIGHALGRASSVEPGRYRIVVIRSTVPPGTTEGVVIPLLEAEGGLQAGHDFGVCMSPEYLRQRQAERDASAPRLVVIGQLDDRSGDLAERLNTSYGCPVFRVSIREAEFQKYVHNLFNASKISFFNELRRVATAIGVDAERVFELVAQSSEAMWNAQYGTFDLGPYAGACLPKDVEAFLTWTARRGLDLPILSAVDQANQDPGTD